MVVKLQKLGKRYSRHWIFRNIQETIFDSEQIAITGPNGSGKSTFIQILSGAQPMTEGKVSYYLNNKEIESGEIFQYITFAAPYTQLVEELTLVELYRFHKSFKKIQVSFEDFYQILEYPFKKDQQIKFYSSGMKQRVKLALAILSESEMVILDEPTSNLDREGKDWYQQMIKSNIGKRTLVIASNDPEEYQMVDREVSVDQSSN